MGPPGPGPAGRGGGERERKMGREMGSVSGRERRGEEDKYTLAFRFTTTLSAMQASKQESLTDPTRLKPDFN